MASDRMRALVDDLAKSRDRELARLRAGNGAPAPADNPLGLRFAKGARVLDLALGLQAAVTRGERDPLTGAGRYAIRLDDGRLVYRLDSELEPAPTTA